MLLSFAETSSRRAKRCVLFCCARRTSLRKQGVFFSCLNASRLGVETGEHRRGLRTPNARVNKRPNQATATESVGGVDGWSPDR